MPKIIITRNKGWYGRVRAATILADQVPIGRIKAGETWAFEVPDDAQFLRVKMDWGRSEPYPIANLTEGKTIYVNSWFTLNPLRNLGIMTLPVSIEDQPR